MWCSVRAKQGSQAAVVSSSSAAATEVPVADESKPVTTLQIVLANGRKITWKFNLTHTIRHVQAVIARSVHCPSTRGISQPALLTAPPALVRCLCRSEDAASAPYRLLTGFPPAEITDFGRTLEEAGLKNARITQKLA